VPRHAHDEPQVSLHECVQSAAVAALDAFREPDFVLRLQQRALPDLSKVDFERPVVAFRIGESAGHTVDLAGEPVGFGR
jgi:hypothetical protein